MTFYQKKLMFDAVYISFCALCEDRLTKAITHPKCMSLFWDELLLLLLLVQGFVRECVEAVRLV